MPATFLRRLFVLAFRAGVCGVILLMSTSLHAAVIFSDDFHRSNDNDAGNLWQEWEKDGNDVAVYSQQLRLRDHQSSTVDAAAWRRVDTNGYENLNLSFDWRASNSTESSDTLFAGWRDASGNFHSLWSQALGGSPMVSHSMSLDTFGLSKVFDLSFWVDVSAATETVYLDNILLTGDAQAPHSTSPHRPAITVEEPAMPGLFCLALTLLLTRLRGHC